MATTRQFSAEKTYGLMLATITWLSIVLQLYLTTGSFFNFISYFTILSNILVALGLSLSLAFSNSNIGRFFALATVKSAIALYIFIVALVYNLVLRSLWAPTGWRLIADNLLHVLVPLLYILYWFIFIPKGSLNWKDGVKWIYFPLAYLFYTLIRGHFTHWYPYPFMDVGKFGYQQVLINVGLMIMAFFLVGLLLIMVNRVLRKKEALN